MTMRVLVITLLAAAVGSLLFPLTHVRAQSVPSVDAKIEVVWPHDHQGQYVAPDQAHLVNVEVELFQRGTLNPVACDFPNPVMLHWALDSAGGLYPTDQPLPPLLNVDEVQGQRILRTQDGEMFPVWVFNDVPVLPTHDSFDFYHTTYFMVEVGNANYRTNVWAHGSSSRTLVQYVADPTKLAITTPQSVAALIRTVWPHDNAGRQQPVSQAPLVNIAVELFRFPVYLDPTGENSAISVQPSFANAVHVLEALNNGYLNPVPIQPQIQLAARLYGGSTIQFPLWALNNIDVSAIEDPRNTYYFAVQVDGLPTHTTVWTHGVLAQTYAPTQDLPTGSCVG